MLDQRFAPGPLMEVSQTPPTCGNVPVIDSQFADINVGSELAGRLGGPIAALIYTRGPLVRQVDQLPTDVCPGNPVRCQSDLPGAIDQLQVRRQMVHRQRSADDFRLDCECGKWMDDSSRCRRWQSIRPRSSRHELAGRRLRSGEETRRARWSGCYAFSNRAVPHRW